MRMKVHDRRDEATVRQMQQAIQKWCSLPLYDKSCNPLPLGLVMRSSENVTSSPARSGVQAIGPTITEGREEGVEDAAEAEGEAEGEAAAEAAAASASTGNGASRMSGQLRPLSPLSCTRTEPEATMTR